MGWAAAGMAAMHLGGGIAGAVGNIKSAKASAKAAAMEAAGRAADLRTQGVQIAANSMLDALNYDAQADYYLRAAGRAQAQGMQERVFRGLELGEDKGRIVTQAAGSGIDVSSGVVGKTLRDTVKSAYHDMEISAANEYDAAYGAMKNRAIAKTNARNKRSIADWAGAAYDSLAGQVEAAGAISARNILSSGYSAAFGSLLGGAFSAAGSVMLAGSGKGSGGGGAGALIDNTDSLSGGGNISNEIGGMGWA